MSVISRGCRGRRAMLGLEFGAPGRITAVVGASRRAAAPALATKFAAARGDVFLAGYATKFGKPHVYKGRVEVFTRGCFARNLVAGAPAVMFLVGHKETELLGTSADRLELMQDEHGLPFRLLVPDTGLGREVKQAVAARTLSGMSVSYQVLAEETKAIDGTPVRFLHDVLLREISVCSKGAVDSAFATVLAADGAVPFEVEVKSGAILREGAFVMFMRSLDRLSDHLGKDG